MKKSLVAVFSVSLTAGTICLAYVKAKEFFIRKVDGLWQLEAQKRGRSFTSAQTLYLKNELEKLFPWQIKFLHDYYTKLFNGAPLESLKPYIEKILKQKLSEKVDFHYLDEVFAGTSLSFKNPETTKTLTPTSKQKI